MLIRIVAVWFAVLAGLLFFLTRTGITEPDSWAQITWLTTYEHGFVRRGFTGQILVSITDILAIPPLVAVWLLQHLLSSSILILILLIVRKTGVNWITLLLVISPVTLLFTVNDVGIFGRGDVLFPVLMLSYLFVLRDRERLSAPTLAVLGLAAIGTVLTHEATAFFAPLFVLLYLSHIGRLKAKFHTATALVIPAAMIGSMAVVFLWGMPADDYPERLCQSLVDIGFEEKHCGGAVSWPSDLQSNITRTAEKITENGFLLKYPIAILAALAPFGLILLTRRSIRPDRGNTPILLAISISLVAMIPLFILAMDWGRWIYIYFMGVMIVWLASSGARVSVNDRNYWHRYSVAYVIGIGWLSMFWTLSGCCSGANFGGIVKTLYRIYLANF